MPEKARVSIVVCNGVLHWLKKESKTQNKQSKDQLLFFQSIDIGIYHTVNSFGHDNHGVKNLIL